MRKSCFGYRDSWFMVSIAFIPLFNIRGPPSHKIIIMIGENKLEARIPGSGSGPSTVHCLAGAMIVQHPPALGLTLFLYMDCTPPFPLKPSQVRSRRALGLVT
jgi:hypothetical protein